jgi:hypothetical protein
VLDGSLTQLDLDGGAPPEDHWVYSDDASTTLLIRSGNSVRIRSIFVASKLLDSTTEDAMETLVIGGTLLGSFVGAFMIQKAALEGLFRILNTERRSRR